MTTHHTPEVPRLDELPPADAPLSLDGLRRRHAMLGRLEHEVRSRGRRRIASRAGMGAAGIALLVALSAIVWHMPRPTGPPPQMPIAAAPAPQPPPPQTQPPQAQPPQAPSPTTAAPVRAARLVAYVVDDPKVVKRLAPDASGPTVELLDDDALLRELQDAGMPAGLVRTPGRTRLAFNTPARPQPIP